MMRSTADDVTVRLYHLADGPDGAGIAATLMYGPLAAAMACAAQQAPEIQNELYIATDNDVVAYLDLLES